MLQKCIKTLQNKMLNNTSSKIKKQNKNKTECNPEDRRGKKERKKKRDAL